MKIAIGNEPRVAGSELSRQDVRLHSFPRALRAVTTVAAPLAKSDAAFEWPTFSEAESTVQSHPTSKSGVSATALQDLRRLGGLTKVPRWFVIMALLLLGFDMPALHAQGNLTPAGPPGATMLTLSQVEPRTPINAIHTPGNGSVEFAITNSGSYFLTTNLFGVSGEGGIGIYTNNVTLDLNGYSLQGGAPGLIGIQAFMGTTNVIVRNGIISGWGQDGVYCAAYDGILQNLSVTGNGWTGLVLGSVGQIKNCTASGNQENGISIIANGCLISGNVCNENNQAAISGDGGIIVLEANSRIENNHLTGNTAYGIEIVAELGDTNNMIVGNSVQGDGANDYYYSTAQVVGPIMTNNATGIITNSNPWANFQF